SEWTQLYRCAIEGRSAELPPLPVRYVDFAEWQRGWLQGDVLEHQLAYWKRRLGGDITELGLPRDRPRPRVPEFSGRRLGLKAPAALAAAIDALGRREGATPFATLLTTF